MNECQIAEKADLNILGNQAGDRHRPSGLCQELGSIDQRAVRIRAQKIRGENFVEAAHVTSLHRCDIILIQCCQRRNILCHCCRGHLLLPTSRPFLIVYHEVLSDYGPARALSFSKSTSAARNGGRAYSHSAEQLLAIWPEKAVRVDMMVKRLACDPELGAQLANF